MPHVRRRSRGVAGLAACAAMIAACSSSGHAPRGPRSAPVGVATALPPHITAPPNPPSGVPAGVRPILLDLGSAPSTIAFGFGSVWVGSHRGTQLYRIDPKTNQVAASIHVGPDACFAVIGTRYVYAGRCNDGSGTAVIDPATNKIVRRLAGEDHPDGAYVAGRVWGVLSDGALAEFDPTTLRRLRTVDTPAFDRPIPGGGRIWLQLTTTDGDYTGGFLGVDPRSGKVVDRFKVAGDPSLYGAASYTAGALWLADGTRKALMRIDPKNGAARAYPIPNFKQFANYFWDVELAVAGGRIWLRSSPGVVTGFDARTGRAVHTYPDDPNAGGGGLGAGFGSIWEPNFMSDTVWRVPA